MQSALISSLAKAAGTPGKHACAILPKLTQPALIRGLSLLQATALNMSNMVGVGPFITIPLIISAMGGPQCMLGWLLGTILALSDGLIWSELAAAMPSTGGTFLYLRESFRHTKAGRLLPFLFIWQFVFSGPLEIASGYIGFAQYIGYFWRTMGPWETRLVAASAGVVTVVLLYRNIRSIGKITVVLWIGMLATVVWVIASGLANFQSKIAFDFPPNAFTFTRGFILGLGGATLIAMYDFLGYYDVCYVAGEVREPARVIPRSILFSVAAIAAIYSVMNLSIIGVVPWREAMQSKFIASEFMERIYGGWAGSLVTVMILWTCLTSCFALMLGTSRIPYAAALEGYFFKPFAALHPTGRFPHIALLAVGGLSILAAFIPLDQVLSALMTTRILVQFMGQIAAVHLLRKRSDIERPFRIWLYPLPSIFAFAGWSYVFATAGTVSIAAGLVTLAAGVLVFWIWNRSR